jgi:hypothetical protein
VLRLKGNPSLEMIHVIKKPGGTLRESFLDEGFILDKKIGVGQPKRVENAKILVRSPPPPRADGVWLFYPWALRLAKIDPGSSRM